MGRRLPDCLWSLRSVAEMATRWEGSRAGRGWRSMVFTRVNTVVVAPMPSARVRMAKEEKTGERPRLRKPYWRSRMKSERRFAEGGLGRGMGEWLSLDRKSVV